MDLHAFVWDSSSLGPTTDEGPLRGMDVAVKDLFAVRGHVSSFGHPVWRSTHSAAERDARVVQKTLGGGARIVGLTKMDQLAYSLIGNVGEGTAPVNAFRPSAYCGGSSSGTASAVAGGEATVGIGTDTAGSIRVPAAVCGLHGLRPTHGAIDADGAIPLAASFDVIGLCAATLAPMQRLHEQLAGSAVPTDLRRVLVADAPLGSTDEHGVLTSFAAALAKTLGTQVTSVPVGDFVSADAGDLLARVQGRRSGRRTAAGWRSTATTSRTTYRRVWSDARC